MTKNTNLADPDETIYEFAVQSLTISDYTTYENTLLMRILKVCQPDIKDAIEQQTKLGHLVLTPRETSEHVRHVKIPMRKLEPNRGHYARLRAALEDMSVKPVCIAYLNKSGKVMFGQYPHLFAATFYHENRTPYVELHSDTDLLYYYLNISMGYHKLDLSMYFSFNNLSTRQMYRLYSAYFKGGRTKLKPQVVAGLLSGTSRYQNYASVAKNLLKPSAEEMERHYRNGSCDVHFRYMPIYNPSMGTHTKWCDMITFTFMSREDEHPQGARLEQLKGFQTKTKVLLMYAWGVKESVAIDLCQRIRLDMMADLDDFFAHKKWFVQHMADLDKPMHNKAGFIVKNLGDFLDKREAA